MMVNQILISTFQGFSKHSGKILLTDKLKEIASSDNQRIIGKIRALVRDDKKEEAARVKRQLQGSTLSATYTERRIPEKIESYTDILMIDIDGLPEEALHECRERIIGCPYTLFCFVSPSGNGLKAGVYMTDDFAEQLRATAFRNSEIGYDALEHYHKQMFDYAKAYYERLTGVEVDPSGSDIGRLFFTSYDPDIYIDEAAIGRVRVPAIAILPPAPKEKKKSARQLMKEEMPGRDDLDCSRIDLSIQVEFQKCVRATQREEAFEPGHRDNFLFSLGNRCYRRNLPQQAVSLLAEKQFGAPDLDIQKIISNAYKYTGRTDEQEEEKKKPAALRIIEFISRHYDIRRNIVQDRLEFRDKTPGTLPGKKEPPYVPMKRKHYNTVFYDLQMAGIGCQLGMVKGLIDSRYAKDFNPFIDYFGGLAPYDGKRDYIAELAATIKTTDPTFWTDCFKRWLVGMVACALDDDVVNQLAIVLKGEQGKGKSTWIRHLLPPPLRTHYRNGMINPDDKDHMIFLSQCLIINLEEFEGMKNGNIAELKRLITQESMTERKAFDTDADLYIRRCSFIASTNEPRFLKDDSGNRRFPTITALEIDYKTPVNYEGVYAQALHLWKSGFHYWYEQEEIVQLNEQNRQYSLTGIEEELLYVYARKPLPGDLSVKWMPAAAILSIISMNSKVQMNDRNVRNLIRILERDGFPKRINANNICEYELVQYSFEQVEENFKKSDKVKNEDMELPF